MPNSASKFVFIGAAGFAVVSLAGFAVWAFAGRWFYRNVGEAGLYLACAVVFIALAGLLLHPLIQSGNRILRFYKTFIPAFLAYVVVWSVCWFALRFGLGEWLGSFAGCAAFGFVLLKLLASQQSPLPAITLLFIAHSAGYFLGGQLYAALGGFPLLAKLLWGLSYGAGFGAGIGFAYYHFQRN